MSFKQKIISGLSLLVLLLPLLSGLLPSPANKVQAATGFTEAQLNAATFKFTNKDLLNVTIAGKTFGAPVGSFTTEYFYIYSGRPPGSDNPEFCGGLQDNAMYVSLAEQKKNPGKGTAVFRYVNSSTGACSTYPASGALTISVDTAAIGGVGGSLVGQTCDPANPSTIPAGYNCVRNSGGNFVLAVATTTPPTTPPATTQDCWSGGTLGLEWAFCALLKGIDSAIVGLDRFINGQLEFSTGDATIQAPGTQSVWSTFRIIATALLVIIMLIAVISQALGGGWFDAYTIRKILPKLAIAVILIQLSWVLFGWVINFVNDIGGGIRSLMFAPFGGDTNMHLDKLFATPDTSFLPDDSRLFLAAATAGAAIGAAFLTAAGVLALAVPVLLAVLIGFITLVARKIVIILCLVLAPIALVAWILPGTEQYYKTWWKAFSRALIMFPLIVSLIAVGRIFAYVGSGSTATIFAHDFQVNLLGHHLLLPAVPVAAISGFASFMLVLVGYFGPYAILPKTFQWGGAALGAVGGALSKIQQRASQPSSQYLNKIAGENRGFNRFKRAEELARTPAENRSKWNTLLAGGYNPFRRRLTFSKSKREEALKYKFAQTLAEGQKAIRESVGAELLETGFENWAHRAPKDEKGEDLKPGQRGYVPNKLDYHSAMLEGKDYDWGKGVIKHNDARAAHSFDELARLGDPDRIRKARAASRGQEHVWTQGIARNFGRLNEIMRDYTLAPDLSKLNPRQFASQDADTAQELIRQVKGGYKTARGTGLRDPLSDAEAADQRVRAVQLSHEIMGNPLLWADLSADHREVVEELAGMGEPTGVVAVPDKGGRGIARTIIPSGTNITSTEAQGNLTRALADERTGDHTAVAVAEKLANPYESAGYVAYMQDLYSKRESSPEAGRLYAKVAKAYHGHLDSSLRNYEQEQLASGKSGDQIQTIINSARVAAEHSKASLPRYPEGEPREAEPRGGGRGRI